MQSDSKKFQFDFWSRFRDKLLDTNTISSLQTPRPQYWFNISLGKTYLFLSATCNTSENVVGVKIYIGNKIADKMLPFLENQKEEVERSIGQKLTWNPYPEKQDKMIVLERSTDLSDPREVEEALDWLVEYTLNFREVFSRLIQSHK